MIIGIISLLRLLLSLIILSCKPWIIDLTHSENFGQKFWLWIWLDRYFDEQKQFMLYPYLLNVSQKDMQFYFLSKMITWRWKHFIFHKGKFQVNTGFSIEIIHERIFRKLVWNSHLKICCKWERKLFSCLMCLWWFHYKLLWN